MRFTQERVQDGLTLGDRSVAPFELAVLAERIDLVQRELERVQIARREGATLLCHLDCERENFNSRCQFPVR